MKKDKNRVLKLTAFLLNLTWYTTWIMLGLYLISSLLIPFVTYKQVGVATYVNAIPVHFEVPAPAVDPNVEINTGDSPKEISITDADGIVSFTTQDIKLNLIATFGMIMIGAMILFVIFQLKKIVAKVKEGKPFVSENLGRIRKINVAIFTFVIVNGLYEFITSSIVQNEFYTQFYLPSVKILPVWEFFNSDLILLVLIILVIEQSFRIGLKLQEDKDLTI